MNPDLLRDIKRHGAFDISACFHCGNCTAVCPLTDEHGSFPRKMIRLGQIGDRERLLASPEPWLCYYCGECSETCPRQAEPGEYMAALRRYAIGRAEPTGLGRLMARWGAFSLLVTLLVGIVLAAFLLAVKAPSPDHWLFRGVSYETIHLTGMVVFGVTALTIAAGVATVWRRMTGAARRVDSEGPAPRGAWVAALKRTGGEIATMRRHREESPDSPPGPWYTRAGWVHLAIMFGFTGLLLATGLDYVFLVLLPLGLKVFWPARILGTAAGLAMMVGVTAAVVRRLRKADRSVAASRLPDWWVLAFLFVLGVTGFWLEAAVTLGLAGPVQDAVLLIHAAMAMELVLLMAFTKMAHVLYRPIALFAYYLRSTTA